MPITEADKAYVAGIIDGEGCIGACALRDKRLRRKPSVFFTVHVSMTDKVVPQFIQQLYGCHVRVHHRRGSRDGHQRRPLYIWQGYGDAAARLLRDVLPYLKIKRGQAEAYLIARTTFTGGPRKGFKGSTQPTAADRQLRNECLYKIKQLNQRRGESHALG